LYLYQEHKPKWWAFLADPRGNRVIVHPSVITDIGSSSRKWRVQFQAPPQIATYIFDFHVKSDSYCGTDIIHQVTLQVQDASKLEEKSSEDIIPEAKSESKSCYVILVNLRFY
jgi:translocation protein SEC63